MDKQFSYGKKEKLKGRNLTEALFSQGRSFTVFPLKVFYRTVETPMDFPLKAGVGVSRRLFKKAVDRNRVKRLLREAYRVEKAILVDHVKNHGLQAALFILYLDKTLPDQCLLQSKMPIVIERLIKQLHEKSPANT